MFYEVRTYTFRPGTLAEFVERYSKRLPLREKHSKLGAFWQTEVGPLNQAIHVYPYESLEQRTAVREAMAKDTALAQLPGGRDLIVEQQAEIVVSAPFMHPLGSRDYGTGNVYEMRIYTFAPGDIPKVLDGWGKAIEAREKFSPLAACWTNELGGLNRFWHLGVQGPQRACTHPGGNPHGWGVAPTDWSAADSPGKQAPGGGALLTCAVVARSELPLICPPGRAWPLGQRPRPGTC